jgi:hypothetical protein
MATFHPVFRLTVFQPRSTDSTESTPLVPRAGAAHSDPFVVTTLQGVSGSKPYLDLPSSRSGTIDVLNKKTTIGMLTIRVLDARTTAGGGNASRWVTAFLGDDAGGNILLGRKAKLEQSLDGGTTWASYFTGRISGPALQGKLWVQLSLRDIADDLGMDLFVGAPYSAVASYAALAQVAPLGLLQPVRSAPTATSPGVGYAGLPLTQPLRGKTNAPSGKAFTIDLDVTYGDKYRATFTQAIVALMMRVPVKQPSTPTDPAAAELLTTPIPPKVMIAAAGTGVYVEYDLDQITASDNTTNTATEMRFTTTLKHIQVRQSTKNGSAAPPAAGTVVDYYIVDPIARPSDSTPLLVDDRDPVLYAQDLCAGYFGRLDKNAAVTRSVPFNANGIDGSKLIPWRNVITAASKLSTELEALCIAYHWAYYVDASGTVTLVDLRRSAIPAPVATLTDTDLESTTSALAWQQDRDSAVTSVLGTVYPEQQISAGELPKPFDIVTSLSDLPDVPTVRVTTLAAVSWLSAEIGPRSGDMKPSTLKVDVKGFRFRVDPNMKDAESFPPTASPAQPRSSAIQNFLSAYGDEISGPFGLGPSFVDVVCRRASVQVAGGTFAVSALSCGGTTTATITTAAPHGLTVGSVLPITIAGAAPSGYNGTFTGTVAGASTITYSVAAALANATGTITATTRGVTPGSYAQLNLSALPDPASNQRGGVRLGLCVNRTDDGPRIKLRFLDAGEDSVKLPPTVGAPALNGGDISLPITRNAAGDPVRVRWAATAQSVGTRPADDDSAWVNGPLATLDGTVTLANLPAGARIWLEARSV